MYLTYNVADYFNEIINLEGKKVLDFGCNHANFIKYGFNGDYTGIDIDFDIIQQNKKLYPDYKFIHYNRHNNQYNISNIKTAIPLKEEYDIICAFSVFTHTCFVEFNETVKELKNNLAHGGKILATYIEISDSIQIELMFKYRQNILKNIDINNFLINIKKYNTVSIAVDLENLEPKIYYNTYSIPDFVTPTYFITMYNKDWIEKNLNAKTIDVTYKYDDIRAAQKCLVIE